MENNKTWIQVGDTVYTFFNGGAVEDSEGKIWVYNSSANMWFDEQHNTASSAYIHEFGLKVLSLAGSNV